MAILKTPITDLDQVICLDVSWEAYLTLTESLGDDGRVQLTYDGETLEIMSPGRPHERYANRISELMSVIIYRWRVNYDSTGQTTFKSRPKGFEGDRTYYIVNADKVAGVTEIDLGIHPPPDLVVEIDISTPKKKRVDKFKLYAQLGIPEFWRYMPQNGLAGFALIDSHYAKIDVSRVIAGLPLFEIERRMDIDVDLMTVIDEWHQWLNDRAISEAERCPKPRVILGGRRRSRYHRSH